MKRTSFISLCNLFMLCALLSCARLDRNRIDLSVSENEQYYTIIADYNKNQTKAVENYLDRQLGKNSNMSFANTRIDGNLTLDNGMKFFIKKYPGYLKIKFNRNENSVASYTSIKHFSEGLKPVLHTQ